MTNANPKTHTNPYAKCPPRRPRLTVEKDDSMEEIEAEAQLTPKPPTTLKE